MQAGPIMNLTEHFTLEELTHSHTAVRLGIDNAPAPELVARLRVLASGLEEIRRILGRPVLVNSGYRCEALEKVLCGKDYASWCSRHQRNSESAWPEYFQRKAHPRGYAADFICPRFGTPAEIVKRLRQSGLKFDQLIEEGTWVHASFDPQLRGELLVARFDRNGTPTYTSG